MLVARRHIERVVDLDEPAWEQLHPFVRVVTRRTREAFDLARFDLSFPGDEDRHVHLRLVPRYAEDVELDGGTFTDPGFPGRHRGGRDGRMDGPTLAAIAGRLRLEPADPKATVYDHFLPPRRVRPTALCVLSRGEEILVGEGHDPGSGLRFLRPPGGEVEFGETSRDAVVREVHEELGVELTGVRQLGVLEEVYTHRGETGHEVAFIFDGRAVDASVYDRDGLTIREEVGAPTRAFWATIDDLRADDRTVVPPGLLDLVERDRVASRRG